MCFQMKCINSGPLEWLQLDSGMVVLDLLSLLTFYHVAASPAVLHLTLNMCRQILRVHYAMLASFIHLFVQLNNLKV